MRRKSRKHVRSGKKGRRKISIDRGSTSLVDEFSVGSECVPNDIDVAKWVLGVHGVNGINNAYNSVQTKSGYHSMHSMSPINSRRNRLHRTAHSQSSPLTPPPTPVRSSSRIQMQRLAHNYNYPFNQNPMRLQSGLAQKNNVRKGINKYSAKSANKKSPLIPLMTNKKLNKTKSKSTDKTGEKKNIQNRKSQKSDRSGSKIKRSHSRVRSLSRRRQVCDEH